MTTHAFRNSHPVGALLSMLMIVLVMPVVMAQSVREYPPAIPPAHLLNGGRVHSIAVSPTNRDQIIVSHQVGGLWQTENGGRNWYHVNGLQEIRIRDVAYGADGRTIVATVGRDLKRDTGAGIWVNRNLGSRGPRRAACLPMRADRHVLVRSASASRRTPRTRYTWEQTPELQSAQTARRAGAGPTR